MLVSFQITEKPRTSASRWAIRGFRRLQAPACYLPREGLLPHGRDPFGAWLKSLEPDSPGTRPVGSRVLFQWQGQRLYGEVLRWTGALQSAGKIMAFTRQAKQQILDAILMRSEEVEGSTDLMSFLGRVWPLEQMPSEDGRFKTASGDIHKHMVMNDDWTTEELYTRRLALIDAQDDVFERFLTAYVHPLVRRDVTLRYQAVAELNPLLGQHGYQFTQTGQIDNPRYELSGSGRL